MNVEQIIDLESRYDKLKSFINALEKPGVLMYIKFKAMGDSDIPTPKGISPKGLAKLREQMISNAKEEMKEIESIFEKHQITIE